MPPRTPTPMPAVAAAFDLRDDVVVEATLGLVVVDSELLAEGEGDTLLDMVEEPLLATEEAVEDNELVEVQDTADGKFVTPAVLQ